MLWFIQDGDPGWFLVGTLLSMLTGALSGAATVAVGLVRGHRTLGWTGGVVCLIVGLAFFLVAGLAAAGFIGVMLVTEPIEPSRRRRRRSRAWADQDYMPALETRSGKDRSGPRSTSPPTPPVRGMDEVPDVVDELPPDADRSEPVPAVHPVLSEIRTKLGPSPRWFTEEVLTGLTVRRPAWVGQDELEIVLRDQRAVLAMGEVFWGVLVQTHPALTRPGPLDHPATLVYSRDAAVVRDPARLVAVARRISDLKHTRPESPGLRRFTELLADDRRRAMRWDVPESIAGGLSAYLTTVLAARSHLPGRMLIGELVPVIVRYDTTATLIVPSALWPRGFRVAWEEQATKVTESRPWLTIMPAAAVYLKRRAEAEKQPTPWCLRLWIERDIDRANARIQTRLGPLDADPVHDRRFGGGGIIVVIPRTQEDEFRGVEIAVTTVEGQERLKIE